MKRRATAVLASIFVVLGQTAPLLAGGRGGGGGRGSVSAASRGGSGGSGSWQSRNGNVSGSRSVSQTSSGYNVNRQASTASGASHEVNKSVDTSGGQVQSVNRTSTATNASGQSANRDRTTTNEGGYASVQGNASTSTGREASGQGAVGKNAYGQTVADRKRQHEVQRLLRRRGEAEPERHLEHGDRRAQRREGHADPAVRLQDDDLCRHALLRLGRRLLPALHLLRRAVLLPGSAALLLPVHLRAGGGDRRDRGRHDVHDVGGKLLPADHQQPGAGRLPDGAGPAGRRRSRRCRWSACSSRVGGTTYYLYANTFYRRVVQGGQESFVVVTAPAGVVMVAALPANFEVMQLNTLYFAAGGTFYVRYLAPDGKELYVGVDPPPQPAAAGAASSGRGSCRTTAGRRAGVPHRERVAERAGGNAGDRAHGVHRQLDERARRRSIPGVPRP